MATQQSVDSISWSTCSRPWPSESLRMHSLNAEPKLCTTPTETGGDRVAIEWRYVALVAVGLAVGGISGNSSVDISHRCRCCWPPMKQQAQQHALSATETEALLLEPLQAGRLLGGGP